MSLACLCMLACEEKLGHCGRSVNRHGVGGQFLWCARIVPSSGQHGIMCSQLAASHNDRARLSAGELRRRSVYVLRRSICSYQAVFDRGTVWWQSWEHRWRVADAGLSWFVLFPSVSSPMRFSCVLYVYVLGECCRRGCVDRCRVYCCVFANELVLYCDPCSVQVVLSRLYIYVYLV